MYAGHFAAGFAIKARAPDAPTWGVLIGVGLLDLLFGPFVLAGWERVTLTPGVPPGFALDYIDWSHSLVMSVVWAAAYGLCFLRQGRPIALVMGVAVLSHFVLDWFMHPADLALWPGSRVHLGLGLWRLFPVGWWFFELGFIGLSLAYYYRRSRTLRTFGHRGAAIVVVIVFLHVANSPWLAPH
jgi:hypothetical protein